MKKLFTTFLLMYAMFVSAQSVVVTGATEYTPGVYEFTWVGDTTLSAAYQVELARVDTVTYDAQTFSMVGALYQAFVNKEDSTQFVFWSDMLLYYGQNYEDIAKQGAPDSIVTAWQQAWQASVNENEYTLNAGIYAVFVTGLNATGTAMTETTGYALFMIQDITEDIVFIKVKNNTATKYFDGKNVYILKNGKVYDVLGNVVKQY